VLAGLLVWMLIESIPAGLPNTPAPKPALFARMRELPGGYGVLDLSTSEPATMKRYYQTQFEMPALTGLSSRLPRAVVDSEARVEARAQRGEWQGLCQEMGFRYVLLAQADAVTGDLVARRPVLEGDGFRIFDLGELWKCR
jgi:hypothetical protein